MKDLIDRRLFLQRCLTTSADALVSSLIPGSFLQGYGFASDVTLCAVAGDRIFDNTIAAVDALGGMKKFVSKGASVALLINSVFDRPGTYVNPDIPLAVVKMCIDAGARSIMTIENTPASYWKRASQASKLGKEIGMIGRSTEEQDVTIGSGKSLKDGTVSSALLTCDVFINIPIIKNHEGTRFTGNLKNTMGGFSSSTCRRCHFGDQAFLKQFYQGYYSKMEILSQAIADINLVRSPNLSVADVTEILTTNGPTGPGRLATPMQVVAGTNAVAVDMYGVRHLGLDPAELLVLQRAWEHNLGPRDFKNVKVLTR